MSGKNIEHIEFEIVESVRQNPRLFSEVVYKLADVTPSSDNALSSEELARLHSARETLSNAILSSEVQVVTVLHEPLWPTTQTRSE